MSKIKWGTIAQIGGYGLVGLMLLSVRAANFAEPEDAPVAMRSSLNGNTETYSNQQLKGGQNVISNMVLTRATYLLEKAQQEPNAVEWLDKHRGGVLGRMRAEDDKRGGIWRGNAEDNKHADLFVESMATELALRWVQTKQATPLNNYTLANYLASARMAGSNGGRYDPATMELYLSALGVVGDRIVQPTPAPTPAPSTEVLPAATETPETPVEVSREQQ